MTTVPERPRCEVCGRPLKRSNTVGICTGPNTTPECRRARARLTRRANGVLPRVSRPRTCAHPDGCAEPAHGEYCGTHAARLRKTGSLGPAGLLQERCVLSAGDTFGRWTVIEDYSAATRQSADYRVLCRCACGTERRVLIATLNNGSSRSCGGCARTGTGRRRPRPPVVLAGETFGRLTTLEAAERNTDLVRVRCECGNETEKRVADMKSGHTKSCKCLRWKHGLSKHPLYATWNSMISRTTNPADKDYHRWGGRGITVCERWQGVPDGLRNFIADMGERPAGTTLDRWPDNDGNYELGNVRWGTSKQQGANTRTVPKMTSKLDAVTAERDDLAAELARVNRMLASRRNSAPPPVPEETLF